MSPLQFWVNDILWNIIGWPWSTPPLPFLLEQLQTLDYILVQFEDARKTFARAWATQCTQNFKAAACTIEEYERKQGL
jgi:hypothetical protein